MNKAVLIPVLVSFHCGGLNVSMQADESVAETGDGSCGVEGEKGGPSPSFKYKSEKILLEPPKEAACLDRVIDAVGSRQSLKS